MPVFKTGAIGHSATSPSVRLGLFIAPRRSCNCIAELLPESRISFKVAMSFLDRDANAHWQLTEFGSAFWELDAARTDGLESKIPFGERNGDSIARVAA